MTDFKFTPTMTPDDVKQWHEDCNHMLMAHSTGKKLSVERLAKLNGISCAKVEAMIASGRITQMEC